MEDVDEELEGSPDVDFDDEVDELLENDEISSEEAAFLHGWNKDEIDVE